MKYLVEVRREVLETTFIAVEAEGCYEACDVAMQLYKSDPSAYTFHTSGRTFHTAAQIWDVRPGVEVKS